MYGSDIYYLSTRCMCLAFSNFHKFIYKICLSWLTCFTLHPKWEPYILETSGTFFGGDIKIWKYVSRCKLTGRRGKLPLLFFGQWKEWPCLLGKMPRLQGSMCKFLIKNAVLGVSRWKNPRFFPMRLFVCLL